MSLIASASPQSESRMILNGSSEEAESSELIDGIIGSSEEAESSELISRLSAMLSIG